MGKRVECQSLPDLVNDIGHPLGDLYIMIHFSFPHLGVYLLLPGFPPPPQPAPPRYTSLLSETPITDFERICLGFAEGHPK